MGKASFLIRRSLGKPLRTTICMKLVNSVKQVGKRRLLAGHAHRMTRWAMSMMALTVVMTMIQRCYSDYSV
jgi:hypothetical protein